MIDELKLKNYDFELPKELIAQKPVDKRDECRLLVLNKTTGKVEHKVFKDVIDYFKKGDCLVINSTKVVPARIFGKKKSGGKVELLFLCPEDDKRNVRALVKPFINNGELVFLPCSLQAEIVSKNNDGEFVLKLEGVPLEKVLSEFGQMPLPPYIKREKLNDGKLKEEDKQDYQTVYSRHAGSIAAPTAGLHFTKDVLAKIKAKGVDVIEIVLHVGWGTFKPVKDEDITLHKMLPEYYKIKTSDLKEIQDCKKNGRRVFAVGTTTSRTLETVIAQELPQTEYVEGATSIFIYPGHNFKAVDCFLTNLHTPKSTPLLMTCAFAGKHKVFAAYKEAVEKQYRFYSYGDAMLIIDRE